jgi:hypothetical protein
MTFSARDWECPFRGYPADHLHHMTGRNTSGLYLDEWLVIPLVAPQHQVEHQLWNLLGIGDGALASENWLRLRRISALLVRLGECHRDGVVTFPAETVYQLGLTLNRIADDQGRGTSQGGPP